MTDQTPPPFDPTAAAPPAAPVAGQPTPPPPPPVPAYGAPVPAYGAPTGPGAIGQVRGTGICILLAVVTLGIYPIVWYYKVHDEMKRHTGTGLGGGVALLLAFFVGIVMPYLTAGEVGAMQERAGRPKTVSGTTGLWYFPGIFLFFIGPIVWFVKTNGALNEYWKSLGAEG